MLNKIIFFIPLMLMGCASGPMLNRTPLDIQSNELSEHWEKPADFKTFDVKFGHADKKCRKLSDKPEKADNPYVIYSYLIDTKGRTYERKYLEKSHGAPVNLNQLNIMAEKMVFIDDNVYAPVSANARRTPVRVNSKLYIVELPGDCNLIR